MLAEALPDLPVIEAPADVEPVAVIPEADPAPETELTQDPLTLYLESIQLPERIDVTTEDSAAIDNEIEALVKTLNRIIMGRQYDAWIRYLAPGYRALISKREFLDDVSKSEYFKARNIVVKDARDYFLKVVRPSRTAIQIDKIDIFTPTRAIVYTVRRDERLRVYDLAKDAEGWKIIN
jgi:hypothetical protein